MSDDLTKTAFRGVIWSLSERGGSQLIQLTVSVILARLLPPEYFGLIAILSVFLMVSEALVNAGFSEALIQKNNTTHVDECSVFYFNVFLGFVMAGALYSCAPYIANFYGDAQLKSLGQVLSLNLLVGALGTIHYTLLVKHVDFRTILKVRLASMSVSGAIGIILALKGFGIWSLVVQSVSATTIRTVLFWVLHGWRPAWVISFGSLRQMFPFGFRLLVATLLDVVFSNAYTLVIGKFYSARELGFYSRAEQLQKIPAVNLTSAVRRVIYPTFSKIQDDKARLKRGMRSTVQALALVICPVMIGIAVVAKPLVVTLLTEKWLPSVFYLQLFCAIGMLYPFHAINLSVLKARGRADLFLRLEIIKKALVVVAILVTYRWGISAIIIGSIVVSFMAFYLNAYYTGIHLGYSFKDQVKDVAPPFTVAMIMGACVHFLQFLNISSHLILLSLQVVVGILIYAMICALLRLSAFTGMWQLVRKSSRAA